MARPAVGQAQVGDAGVVPAGRTRRWRFARKFARNRAAMGGLVILLVLAGLSAAAPLVATHDPEATNLSEALQGPGPRHWLGTDPLGRDLWSRVVYGGRISLFASLLAVSLSLLIGVSLGAVAGYYGGWLDTLFMRLTDIMLTFPGILLALSVAAALGSGLGPALIAAVVVSVPTDIRLTRGAVLSVRTLPYIEACHALGATDRRTLLYHVLPNITTPIIIQATLHLATVLLLIAALGFLGLGAHPPTPEWGTLVAEGRAYLRSASYITIVPGIVLMLATLGFNLVGDGLRDALDVKTIL